MENVCSKSKEDIIRMFNEKVYIPDYKNKDSIFYFIREPSIKGYGSCIGEYEDYLNFFEGSCHTLKLENYCFEGNIILDGSFNVNVNYNEDIEVNISDRKLRTIELML